MQEEAAGLGIHLTADDAAGMLEDVLARLGLDWQAIGTKRERVVAAMERRAAAETVVDRESQLDARSRAVRDLARNPYHQPPSTLGAAKAKAEKKDEVAEAPATRTIRRR